MSIASDEILRPRPFTVAEVRHETHDTATLSLVPLVGPVPGYLPGQFNMLYVFGIGESAISISGDPADPGRLVHTVRAVGPVSRALAGLAAGGVVGLRGPFGAGWPIEAARGADVILVAGGLGLAPLRPAVYRILAERERYGRVTLLVGMRNPGEILYRSELDAWSRRRDLEIAVTVDRADARWSGHVGVVTSLIPALRADAGNAVAMICGPELMMRFTAHALIDAGLPGERIHLSMERNMKCAVGFCGHCQLGPEFICKDGPVMRFDRIAALVGVREL